MSGSISFTTVYGKGSKFTFTIKNLINLPYTNAAQNEEVSEDPMISALPLSFILHDSKHHAKNEEQQKKVLIVDDDMVCGHIVASFCKKYNLIADVVFIRF